MLVAMEVIRFNTLRAKARSATACLPRQTKTFGVRAMPKRFELFTSGLLCFSLQTTGL